MRSNKTGTTQRVPEDDTLPVPLATKLGWQGSNDYVEPSLNRIRVYHFEWVNPHSGDEIPHLDLESAMTPVAPTIIAITVE
ncbi:MAG: hypothetical protein ACI8QI_002011 [Limisphaerales bacterium]|jgi:hypothetical protein